MGASVSQPNTDLPSKAEDAANSPAMNDPSVGLSTMPSSRRAWLSSRFSACISSWLSAPRTHHPDRLVEHLNGNGVWMPILAAVRQREAGRIAEPIGRSIHYTTSATIATDRTVRAPTPGVSSRSGKSTGPRSAAAASIPWSRRNTIVGRKHRSRHGRQRWRGRSFSGP
jgi:hypothetical protein